MSERCLTILCPPAVAEHVLDTLLMQDQISLFTSAPSSAHGLSHTRLSATEQVLGMARMLQIQALFAEEDQDALLRDLKGKFAGAGLQYWCSPVIETGVF